MEKKFVWIKVNVMCIILKKKKKENVMCKCVEGKLV